MNKNIMPRSIRDAEDWFLMTVDVNVKLFEALTALERIAELDGDKEKQEFKLTRFQTAQIARGVLSTPVFDKKSYKNRKLKKETK